MKWCFAIVAAVTYCAISAQDGLAVEIVNYPSPILAVDENGVDQSFDNVGSLDQNLQIRSSGPGGQLGGVTFRLPGDLNWTNRCDDYSDPLYVFFPHSVGNLSEGPHDIEVADDYSPKWYFANYPGLAIETYAKCQDPTEQPAGVITRIPVIVDKSPPSNPVITATALTSTTARVCVAVSDPLSGLADVKLSTPAQNFDFPLNGEKTFEQCKDLNFGFPGEKALAATARDFTRHTSSSTTTVTLLAPPRPTFTLTKAVTIAKRKLAIKYGRSWKSGSRKAVTCREKLALFECSATWRFKKRFARGSVLVYKP